MRHLVICLRAAAATAALALLPAFAAAQADTGWDARRSHATRAGLEELLAGYEDAARSSAFSGETRARARQEAELLRTRLAEGDFRVGDRVVMTVRDEPVFSDTFLVAPGRVLVLPLIGNIPLTGVLRSELESHLQTEIGKSVRNPEVRAHSLMQIAILGEVGAPGFFVVPADVPITDILMTAGGTGRDANLRGIRIERGGQRIWDGSLMQQAIVEGRTLDQLSVRAGDQIYVPRQRRTDPWRIVGAVSGSVSLIFALANLF